MFQFSKKNLIIFAVIGVLILAGAIYFGTRGEREYVIEKTPAKELMTAKQAYDLALAEAKKWQADVQPVFLKTAGEVVEGKSEAWQAEFYSKNYTSAQGGPRGEGTKYNYQIVMKDKKIETAGVIESGFKGADMPSSWQDSPQVQAEFSAIPSQKGEVVTELNLYYDHAFQKWFWAVRTAKGVTGFDIR